MILLDRVRKAISDRGYRIGNIDATILAQKPRLSAFLPQMKQRIAQTLAINADQVNIKATTEEKLGFTGEEQGIAAHAVCLLE